MVNAKLHIICGNCGCNDMFTWQYKAVYTVYEKVSETVYLRCRNCSTIHDIEDNARNHCEASQEKDNETI